MRFEQFERDVFGIFQMLFAEVFNVACQKSVCRIVHRPGVLSQNAQLLPCAVAVARFFEQFALGCIHRTGICRVYHSCTQFVARHLESVAVLAHHEHSAFLVNGYDVDPVGVFEYIVFRTLVAVGQAHRIAPHREPWAPEEVFGLFDRPFSVVVTRKMFHVFVCCHLVQMAVVAVSDCNSLFCKYNADEVFLVCRTIVKMRWLAEKPCFFGKKSA